MCPGKETNMIDYRKRRIRLGLTVEQVSEMTGITSRDINFIEAGAISPRLETWYNLYSVLYNGNDGAICFKWEPLKLYHIRTDAGLTQLQLAEKLGVSRKTVNSWERVLSPSIPAVEQLSKICREFGLLPKDFFKKQDKNEMTEVA